MKQTLKNQAKLRVITLIEKAFKNIRREEGITLHQARALDNHAGPAEELKARERDSDTSWKAVKNSDISTYYDVFAFLDLKGFRYYLPAYMVWSLQFLENETSMSPEFLLGALKLDTPASRDVYLANFKFLSKLQRQAVREFLLYIERHGKTTDAHKATAALDAFEGYWRRLGT